MSIRKPREQDLVQPCLQYLALAGCLAWRNNTTGVRRTDRTGRQFWAFTGLRGASDILGVLPPNGRLLAVELKMPGQQPTPAQRDFLDQVAARGGLALVVSSLAQLEAALRLEGIVP